MSDSLRNEKHVRLAKQFLDATKRLIEATAKAEEKYKAARAIQDEMAEIESTLQKELIGSIDAVAIVRLDLGKAMLVRHNRSPQVVSIVE